MNSLEKLNAAAETQSFCTIVDVFMEWLQDRDMEDTDIFQVIFEFYQRQVLRRENDNHKNNEANPINIGYVIKNHLVHKAFEEVFAGKDILMQDFQQLIRVITEQFPWVMDYMAPKNGQIAQSDSFGERTICSDHGLQSWTSLESQAMELSRSDSEIDQNSRESLDEDMILDENNSILGSIIYSIPSGENSRQHSSDDETETQNGNNFSFEILPEPAMNSNEIGDEIATFQENPPFSNNVFNLATNSDGMSNTSGFLGPNEAINYNSDDILNEGAAHIGQNIGNDTSIYSFVIPLENNVQRIIFADGDSLISSNVLLVMIFEGRSSQQYQHNGVGEQ